MLLATKQKVQPSTQAFSSRSLDLARNFVTSTNGITRERVVRGPHSVTSRHFAPSRVERAGGERLGTRLQKVHFFKAAGERLDHQYSFI